MIVEIFASEEYFIRSNHGTTHVYQDRDYRPVLALRAPRYVAPRYVAPPSYSSAIYTVPGYSPRAYYSAPIISAPVYASGLGWGGYGLGWRGPSIAWNPPFGYRMSDLFLKK